MHRLNRVAVFLGLVLCTSPLPLRAQAPPTDAESQFNAGRTHLLEGRPQQALESFKEAIKLDSKNPYFYKGLGQAYLQLRRFPDAVDAFRRALVINPYYVDVRNDLGSALVLAGRREEGRKELMAAYNDAMNPTPELTARNIGQAYFDEKHYSEALNWFQTAVERNRQYADGHVRIADTLMAMNRLNDALTHLETTAKAMPEDSAIGLALGETYYRAGRFAEARTRLEKVAAAEPGTPRGMRAADLLRKFPK
jgi:tetratricopeptide (TPR) repeat protein